MSVAHEILEITKQQRDLTAAESLEAAKALLNSLPTPTAVQAGVRLLVGKVRGDGETQGSRP